VTRVVHLSALLLSIAALCACGDDERASVTLAWDAVTDPNLAGYRVYYGTASGDYVRPGVSVGDHLSFTVTGLRTQTTYYFVVTAYNFLGNESAFSNEASKTIY